MKKAKPFAPLEISASVYNHAVDQYEKSIGKNVTSLRIPPNRREGRILCQNMTGQDLDQYSIVGLGDPVIDPADDETGFLETYCLMTSNIPPTNPDNQYTFGILQESIRNNEFGELLISGITAVKILPSIGPVPYAVPNGTFNAMEAAECGICRVLWMASAEDPATDTDPLFPGGQPDPLPPIPQWALVNIG